MLTLYLIKWHLADFMSLQHFMCLLAIIDKNLELKEL